MPSSRTRPNLYMLQGAERATQLPGRKAVLSLQEFGNTSSASIPLAMTHRLAERLREKAQRLVLAGFGVDGSWGAVAVTCGPIVMSDIVFIDREATRLRSRNNVLYCSSLGGTSLAPVTLTVRGDLASPEFAAIPEIAAGIGSRH